MNSRIVSLALFLGVPLVACTGTLVIGPDAGDGGPDDCLDEDEDGVTTCDDDCDDSDPNNFPGNEEICDAADNDCDGVADAGGVDFVAKAHLERGVQIWHLVDGGLEGPTEITPNGPGISYATVAGDFNADGLLDLIVQRFEDFGQFDDIEIDMYLGDCDGGLEQVDSPSGLFVEGAVDIHTAADVDGDGLVDVVGWDYVTGEGIVWLNVGDGDFREANADFDLRWWGPFNTDRREFVAYPLVDHDGDGLVDLLECTNIAGQQTRCRFSLGNGDGSFEPASEFVLDRLLNGAALADFDGDGNLDILGGLDDDGDAGQTWLWTQDDNDQLTFQGEAFDVNPGDEDARDAPGYGWMYPLDVDYDGDMDVITVTMAPFFEGPLDLHLVINDGDARFGTPERFGTSYHSSAESSPLFTQDQISVPVHAFTD
jgi:hypothetical protein